MNADLFQFLSELKENNYREWFNDNKERYNALRAEFIADVQQLINRIAVFDPDIAGLEAKDCLYRIYRDIRFSPDKTPYKTFFSAYIAQGGRGSDRGGYYLHLEPGSCILSGGIWMPPAPLLKKLRKEIYHQMDEFLEIINNPAFKSLYPSLEGESLKRNPVGYPDSPYNDIIRHKDFTVIAYKPNKFFTQDNWLDETVSAYEVLHPFNKFLNFIVDEFNDRI